MSWYLFKESPAVQQRGKKVQGFNLMPKNRINLSWGMNQPLQSRPSSNYSNQVQNINVPADTVPATLVPQNSNQNEPANLNGKVMTDDTSDDEQQELIKLIKSHRQKKLQQQVMEHFNRKRKKSSSIQNSEAGLFSNKEEKSPSKASRLEMDKRIRYLENHLLPSCRRNSMATILDEQLSKQVPLEESRMSGKSVLHNKKNETTFQMGDGYNCFQPAQEPKKDHLSRLKDQYEYQQKYNRRMQKSNFNFG